MSQLASARSPYLRKAARQPVQWRPYGEEAFREAREKDRPVFLSSGAVWCHWCHVQARESFEDAEVARLLNENFIPVKLDRDERPEVDRRYQQALAVMGIPGGWPLSIFLTPEGRPFFGGTYFPPEDTPQRPAFKRVLQQVLRAYRENKAGLQELSGKLLEHLRAAPSLHRPGAITPEMLQEALQAIQASFDPQAGGFGGAPKFPMPGLLRFLMARWYLAPSAWAEHVLRRTFTQMALGGVYDQLGGGFHRYSVDEAWIVPHFEKLAEDNAWLLGCYAQAWRLLREPLFRDVARGIVSFFRATLEAPQGGFYTSQDADTQGQEGAYYTWSYQEMKKALSAQEFKVLAMHLTGPRGQLPHEPERKVLYVARGLKEVAQATGMGLREVARTLASAKDKLLALRLKRPAPFVDRSLYSSVNGLCISAYLQAYEVLADRHLRDFALRSLGRLLEKHLRGGRLLRTQGVEGLLDDYVHMIHALLDAYEARADEGLLRNAQGLADILLEDFRAPEGGFYDTASEVAGLRLKSIEDVPHPSGNALAIWALLRLWGMTDRGRYLQEAKRALEAFAARATELGLYASSYFYAMDGFYNYLVLRVQAPPSGPLGRACRRLLRPFKVISYGSRHEGRVLPCGPQGCLQPLVSPRELRNLQGRT